MCDAIRHYKANSGNTVTANSNLINHIKKQFNFLNPKSYTYVKANIAEIIQTKIKLERLNGKKKAIIKSEPNSTRSIWYLTLGSFTVNIEYEEEINLSDNYFNFKVHFSGKDLWDFEEEDCEDRNWLKYLECFFHNLFEEKIPNLIVGKGTSFYVEYDFSDDIGVDLNKNYDILKNQDNKKENLKAKENKNDSNNKLTKFFIILIIVVVIIIIIILVYLLKTRKKDNNYNIINNISYMEVSEDK